MNLFFSNFISIAKTFLSTMGVLTLVLGVTFGAVWLTAYLTDSMVITSVVGVITFATMFIGAMAADLARLGIRA